MIRIERHVFPRFFPPPIHIQTKLYQFLPDLMINIQPFLHGLNRIDIILIRKRFAWFGLLHGVLVNLEALKDNFVGFLTLHAKGSMGYFGVETRLQSAGMIGLFTTRCANSHLMYATRCTGDSTCSYLPEHLWSPQAIAGVDSIGGDHGRVTGDCLPNHGIGPEAKAIGVMRPAQAHVTHIMISDTVTDRTHDMAGNCDDSCTLGSSAQTSDQRCHQVDNVHADALLKGDA